MLGLYVNYMMLLVVLKTLRNTFPTNACFVIEIMYYFDNPEKNSFNLVMGVTLDQREYFRDYRLTQKGKLLWDQISM